MVADIFPMIASGRDSSQHRNNGSADSPHTMLLFKNKLNPVRTAERTKLLFFGYHLILPQEIEAVYPIPSAFRAYTDGLNIVLGNAHFLR